MLSKVWGWLAAVLAGVVAVLGIYLKGRASGRSDERQEREQDINEQAAEARQEVQDVERQNAARDDDAVLDAARKWVRNKAD